MAEDAVIETGDWPGFERRSVAGPHARLGVRTGGPEEGTPVLFCHSILTSSAIWVVQATLLARHGFRVVCLDMRGHGRSQATAPPYAMDDLAADAVAVLDVLGVSRTHVVGVSQGGMIALGIGVRHPDRVESLCVVAARADAPPAFAGAWDERIELVEREGRVDSLALPTAERWLGADYLGRHEAQRDALLACIRETSAEGFVGCARAIQRLDYRPAIGSVSARTTLVIGALDGLLLQPMRDLAPAMPDASLHEIDGAGHLPQIDQPAAFNRILSTHLGIR